MAAAGEGIHAASLPHGCGARQQVLIRDLGEWRRLTRLLSRGRGGEQGEHVGAAPCTPFEKAVVLD
jgi:hypothetical protein